MLKGMLINSNTVSLKYDDFTLEVVKHEDNSVTLVFEDKIDIHSFTLNSIRLEVKQNAESGTKRLHKP